MIPNGRLVAALILIEVGAGLPSAATASATTVIGGHNGTHDSSCFITGGASGGGRGAAGLGLSLPVAGPANQCGNLGLTTEWQESAIVLFNDPNLGLHP
ncbi:hypothetical protein [Streptomyces sp. NBC_01803]|uniref:hypothetical protein n=1 Tax=Streptomyces sp. NBC_01803 TaxID=2975946 RepID=UPI002DDB2F02|nr:hypothetical protein [Streptomyces sp. NBC_01803]WSA46345.1 hypothetical protein OIE51_20450 [Streptomyces sp. NBC_01803]